jgi:hypothetical protein
VRSRAYFDTSTRRCVRAREADDTARRQLEKLGWLKVEPCMPQVRTTRRRVRARGWAALMRELRACVRPREGRQGGLSKVDRSRPRRGFSEPIKDGSKPAWVSPTPGASAKLNAKPKAESAGMARSPKPDTVDRLITQALAIEEEDAREAGAMGFMARAMVQATLPHRKVEGTYFERVNGHFTLSMQAHPKIGLPYGTTPRLLLAWVTTEAVKTKNRELDLGASMSGFMRELGLSPTGGERGDITRLKNQTLRLFSSTVSALYEDGPAVAEMGYRLADKSVLWWDVKAPDQAALWQSTVTLSERFFHEIVDRPVPVDMRAIKALKQSPLALDIYSWLTYRVSYMKRPVVIPWEVLALQFGSDYKRLRDFRAAFLTEMKKVVTVYGGAQVEPTPEGLMVKPSPTHIGRKAAA